MPVTPKMIDDFRKAYRRQFVNRQRSHLKADLTTLKQLSDLHYSPALVTFGFCYDMGLGFRKNLKKAMAYYKAAARSGDRDAFYNLGILHSENKKYLNYHKAFKYFKKAAQLRDVPSRTNLGYMYRYGQGCKRNDELAMKHWRMAAKRGDAIAQYNLGVDYIEEYNKKYLGILWLKRAAANGHKKTVRYLKRFK